MLFGMKGDVQGNLFYYDDQRIIYPVGHNVVIYNVDEKTQLYIPGKASALIRFQASTARKASLRWQ